MENMKTVNNIYLNITKVTYFSYIKYHYQELQVLQYFPIKKNTNKTLHKILHEFVSNLGNSLKH